MIPLWARHLPAADHHRRHRDPSSRAPVAAASAGSGGVAPTPRARHRFFLPAPRPTASEFLVVLAPAVPLATAAVSPSSSPPTPDRLTVFCYFPPCFQRMLRPCNCSYFRSHFIPFLIIFEVRSLRYPLFAFTCLWYWRVCCDKSQRSPCSALMRLLS